MDQLPFAKPWLAPYQTVAVRKALEDEIQAMMNGKNEGRRGDLTDCGLAEEYEVLRDILDPLSMPVYLVPGNHDRRAELMAEFGSDGYLPTDGGFLHYDARGPGEAAGTRLAARQTTVP